ncbi:MAG: transposase [Rhodospirillales bacterium]|nr:transposase [Rhodospirillales bacterium]
MARVGRANDTRASRRRRIAKLRAAKTARRIAQVRHNFAHYVSREIADMAGTVVIEDLKVGAMTRSAKVTADDPGSNVRQKAGLDREILATGWSQLRAMLEYKAANVIAVNPACTSQTCRSCGSADSLNRKTQSRFHGVRSHLRRLESEIRETWTPVDAPMAHFREYCPDSALARAPPLRSGSGSPFLEAAA